MFLSNSALNGIRCPENWNVLVGETSTAEHSEITKNKRLRQKENFGVKIRYLTTVYDKHVLNYFHKGKTLFALDEKGRYNINARLGYQGGRGRIISLEI